MSKKRDKKKDNKNNEKLIFPVAEDGRTTIPLNIKILHKCDALEPFIQDGRLLFKAINKDEDREQE